MITRTEYERLAGSAESELEEKIDQAIKGDALVKDPDRPVRVNIGRFALAVVHSVRLKYEAAGWSTQIVHDPRAGDYLELGKGR